METEEGRPQTPLVGEDSGEKKITKWKDGIFKKLGRKPAEGSVKVEEPPREVLTVTVTSPDDDHNQESGLGIGGEKERAKKRREAKLIEPLLIDRITNAWMEGDDTILLKKSDSESRPSLSTKGSGIFLINRSRASSLEKGDSANANGLNAEKLTTRLKDVMRSATRRMGVGAGASRSQKENEATTEAGDVAETDVSYECAEMEATQNEEVDAAKEEVFTLPPTPAESKFSADDIARVATAVVVNLKPSRPTTPAHSIRRKPVGESDSRSLRAKRQQQQHGSIETASTIMTIPTTPESETSCSFSSSSSEPEQLPLELEAIEIGPAKIACLQAQTPKRPPPEPPVEGTSTSPSPATPTTANSNGSESDSSNSSTELKRRTKDPLMAMRLAESLRMHPPPHVSSAPVLPEIRRLSLIEETHITSPLFGEFPRELKEDTDDNCQETHDSTKGRMEAENKATAARSDEEDGDVAVVAVVTSGTKKDVGIDGKDVQTQAKKTSVVNDTNGIKTRLEESEGYYDKIDIEFEFEEISEPLIMIKEEPNALDILATSSAREEPWEPKSHDAPEVVGGKQEVIKCIKPKPKAKAQMPPPLVQTRAEQERELVELQTRRYQLEARRETLLQLRLLQEEEDRVNARIHMLEEGLKGCDDEY